MFGAAAGVDFASVKCDRSGGDWRVSEGNQWRWWTLLSLARPSERLGMQTHTYALPLVQRGISIRGDGGNAVSHLENLS